MTEEDVRDLMVQFEEDLAIIHSHMVVSSPLPLSHVRAILSPILRRWVVEDTLGLLCSKLGYVPTLPALDTASQVAEIDEGGDRFEYFCAGGVSIDGLHLQNLYVSTAAAPDPATSLLQMPPVREYKLGQFRDRKVIYFRGSWLKTSDVIKHMANKSDGVHFDTRREKDVQRTMDAARAFFHIGGAPERGKPLSAPNYIEIAASTSQPWDCLFIETLSIGQALLNIRLNGQPLVRADEADEATPTGLTPTAHVFDARNTKHHA